MSEPAVLAAVEVALVTYFGQLPQRASVSFVGVEPIEVLRFEPVPGERAYVSLGMSRRPMTGAAERVQTTNGPRAELFVHLCDPTDAHAELWRRLAVLAAAPAVEGVVYTPGMTVDLGEALSPRSRCTGVVVTDSPLERVPTYAGPVAVLRVVPATSTELAWCRVRGATALLQRWSAAETDLLDLARKAVVLDQEGS